MSDTDETEGPQPTVFEDGVRDLLTGSEGVRGVLPRSRVALHVVPAAASARQGK